MNNINGVLLDDLSFLKLSFHKHLKVCDFWRRRASVPTVGGWISPASAILRRRREAGIGLSIGNQPPLHHSDKFVIQKTFGEVKNLMFGYNTDIIRE
jgi:hypothetical protein